MKKKNLSLITLIIVLLLTNIVFANNSFKQELKFESLDSLMNYISHNDIYVEYSSLITASPIVEVIKDSDGKEIAYMIMYPVNNFSNFSNKSKDPAEIITSAIDVQSVLRFAYFVETNVMSIALFDNSEYLDRDRVQVTNLITGKKNSLEVDSAKFKSQLNIDVQELELDDNSIVPLYEVCDYVCISYASGGGYYSNEQAYILASLACGHFIANPAAWLACELAAHALYWVPPYTYCTQYVYHCEYIE